MYIYGDLPHWLYIQIQHVLLFCSLPAIEVFEQLTCLGCGQLPDEDMPQKPWPWSWMPARSRKAKGPRACKAFGQTLGDGHGERFPVVFYDCVLFVSKVFVRYLQGTALIKSLIKRGLVLACALYLFSFSWLTPPEPRDLGVTFRTETITISNHQGWILGYIYIIYIYSRYWPTGPCCQTTIWTRAGCFMSQRPRFSLAHRVYHLNEGEDRRWHATAGGGGSSEGLKGWYSLGTFETLWSQLEPRIEFINHTMDEMWVLFSRQFSEKELR